MKYKFGVMSNKWELEAKTLVIAKLVMAGFIGQQVPIAIYEPIEEAFIPSSDMFKMEKMPNHQDIRDAHNSIKEIDLNEN